MATLPRRSTLAALALALGLGGASARGDIYVVRRPDGTLHFTNTRSPGSQVFVRGADGPVSRQGSQVISADGEPAPPGEAAAQFFQSAYVRSMYTATARDPARYARFDAFIREAAQLYQLPEPLVRAVIRQESDFNPYSVSSAGAAGLMQLMSGTASSMRVTDVFDPRQNVLGGTRYLRLLANMFNGDLVLTIAAYNAGANAVIRHAGIPPYEETQHYVRQVLRYYYLYRAGQMPEQQAAAPAPAPAS